MASTLSAAMMANNSEQAAAAQHFFDVRLFFNQYAHLQGIEH
jgi:hypothetical protein